MTRHRHSTCHLHYSTAGVCSACLRHRLSLLQPVADSPNLLIKSKHSTLLEARVCDEPEDESMKMTMKEHIELEFDQPRRKSLWSSSAFTDKFHNKLKPKRFIKDKPDITEVEGKSTVVTRRRSCDTDSRLNQHSKKNPNNIIDKISIGRRSCDTDFAARLNQHDKESPNYVGVESKNFEKKYMGRRSCDRDFRVLSIFDPSRLMLREKKNPNNVEVEAENIEKKSMRRRSCDTDFRVLSIFDPSRLNQRGKKNPNNVEAEAENIEKKSMGRRSCDTDLRVLSVVDEPARASWDGYMIARTIPRLAPMLSVIENAMMNEQMLMEDFETNSVSESSSSQRRNSFDCSSSGKSSSKHRAPVEIDNVESVLPVAKIVVKGDMGFDLYRDNGKNAETGVKNSDSFKRKMLKIMGFKSKSGDPIEKVVGKNADVRLYDLCKKSPCIGENRGDKSRNVRYSSSPINLENGLSPFQLKPSLSRSEKPERKSMLGMSRG